MKKGLTWAAAALIAVTPAFAAENGIHGVWRTPERGGLIEISDCGKGICGKVLGGNGGDPLDSKNKDPALRTRSLIGISIFRDLRPSGGSWKGKIYNPDDGNMYDVTLTLKSPAVLGVRGCIVWPLCRSKNWARVKS
jgi:uncharacterized protein (DUF2147 family)